MKLKTYVPQIIAIALTIIVAYTYHQDYSEKETHNPIAEESLTDLGNSRDQEEDAFSTVVYDSATEQVQGVGISGFGCTKDSLSDSSRILQSINNTQTPYLKWNHARYGSRRLPQR